MKGSEGIISQKNGQIQGAIWLLKQYTFVSNIGALPLLEEYWGSSSPLSSPFYACINMCIAVNLKSHTVDVEYKPLTLKQDTLHSLLYSFICTLCDAKVSRCADHGYHPELFLLEIEQKAYTSHKEIQILTLP